MKIIITDIDGVVFDWETMFHTWMAEKGHTPVDGYQSMYGIHNIYDVPNAFDMVTRFNESAAIGFLDSYGDSNTVLHKFRRNGYVFIGVTAMGTEHYAQRLRVQNIQRHFPDMFSDVHFVDLKESKREILTELAKEYPGVPWVEDNVKNFELGIELGFNSFLMNHGYNQNIDAEAAGGKRVNNWQEIYDTLES